MSTNYLKSEGCSCGKEHLSNVKNIIIGKGAIEKLPEEIKKEGAGKVFLVADKNTYKAAGEIHI